MMLALGAGFVLLGAFLRQRSRRQMARNRNSANRIAADPIKIDLSAQSLKPGNEKSVPVMMPAFIAARETSTEPATGNEGR